MTKFVFRTRYNPGDFSDNEKYQPGTSLTEPGQAETMEQLMARLTRVPNRPISLDLADKDVDSAMEEAELDEFEDEGKTGMAAALDAMEDAFVSSRKDEVAEQSDGSVANNQTANATKDEVPARNRGDEQTTSEVA